MAEPTTALLPWRERRERPKAGRGFASPVVKSLLVEHGLALTDVSGTGANGRVTRADVSGTIDRPEVPVGKVPFDAVRRRTAEHMVRSKRTAAHAAVVAEVDYEAVARARRAHRDSWRSDEGFGLTYLPFVARAVVDAIAAFPEVNATVRDGEVVTHREVHLGVAVDLGKRGLIVPVVHDAGSKRLRAIAREVADLAGRSRARLLSPDDVAGGTFTITNPGPYGTLESVPIVNQPQVAILATDQVARRVVIIEEAGDDGIGIHEVGRLTLSWDHRAFDVARAAGFLARVREILETRPWEMEL